MWPLPGRTGREPNTSPSGLPSILILIDETEEGIGLPFKYVRFVLLEHNISFLMTALGPGDRYVNLLSVGKPDGIAARGAKGRRCLIAAHEGSLDLVPR